MDNKYDVIIIGAGPAGLKCAEELKDSTLKVLLLEKNKVIGPKICAGGLTGLVPGPDMPKGRIKNFTTQTIFLKDKAYKMDLVNPIYTVDRLDLGQHQLNIIENSPNITILKNTLVKSINRDEIKTNNGNYFFRYLVGADGYSSIVRKYLGLETTLRFALYYEAPVITDGLKWYCNVKLLNEGYIWIFPHKDYTNIGIYYNPESINHSKAKLILKEYMSKSSFEFSNINFKGAPISCAYRGCIFSNIFLVGEAAGLASKMLGEGISYALISGSEIGKRILDPDYRMTKLKKILRIKFIQKALLKIFVGFSFSQIIQRFFFKTLFTFLRFRWFQSLFGNQRL